MYTDQHKWGRLATVLESMADIARRADDAAACGRFLAKIADLRREHGTKSELVEALSFFLPTSRFYPLLATLPVPNQSAPGGEPAFAAQMLVHGASLANARELIALCTALDDATIDGDFARQKTTIEGARHGMDALRRRITAAVLRRSQLPSLFEFVLAHPAAGDAERRDAEGRLLRHHVTLAHATPAAGPHADPLLKDGAVDDALRIATGIVAIGVPDALAWDIALEWPDVDLVHQPWDTLAAYVEHFSSPRAAAAQVLLDVVGDRAHAPSPAADLLATALAAAGDARDSHLCQRVLSELYLLDGDYAAALTALHGAYAPLERIEALTGRPLHAARRELDAHLGTVYTHLHAPTHHADADAHLARVAAHDDIYDTEALLARGHLDAARGRWDAALACFDSAAPRATRGDGVRDVSALELVRDVPQLAASERAWCRLHLGDVPAAKAAFSELLARDTDDNPLGLVFRAQLWYRLGMCMWASGGAEHSAPEHAYRCLITAVQRSAQFAPAFTALGRYYTQVSSPPDTVRATKCFQKAFELDAGEHYAAEQLVRGYAAQREWGLVEVIARHVIESEGGSAVALRTSSSAWAHKAIGIVEAQNGRPEHAIASLQIAIRADPRDIDAWTRLGEAYLASGRPVAALKALARARSLAGALSSDTWPIHYDIAVTERALGRHEEALDILARVVAACPEQTSVRVVLAETYLGYAKKLADTGYMLRAVDLLQRALDAAREALVHDSHMRAAWKVAADACFVLASLPRHIVAFARVHALLAALGLVVAQQDTDARLPGVSVVTAQAFADDIVDDAPTRETLLRYAALLYKHLVVMHAGDDAAAHMWTELATTLCRLDAELRERARHASAEDADALAAHAAEVRGQGRACIGAAQSLRASSRQYVVLGNLAFSDNAALAQHAYIMAIELEAKSPVPWTNLGMLYLRHRDHELAEQAFLRAQTLDPEWAPCWLGRAMVLADRHSDDRLSRSLFHHAISLSQGSLLEADYRFALSTFQRLEHAPLSAVHAVASLFAMNSHVANAPTADALHLAALLAEQLGALSMAIQRIESASSRLEAEYEASESVSAALKYSVATANLGRIRLAHRDTAGAADAFATAIALLDEGDADALAPGQKETARASAELGLVLARYFDGEHDAHAEMLEFIGGDALATLPPHARGALRAHAAVAYAGMCWANGPDADAAAAALDDAYVAANSLAHAPHDLRLLVTRIAVAASLGRQDEYQALVRQRFGALPPAKQRALAESEHVTRLGILTRAAAGDTPGLLSYLAQIYWAPGRPVTTLHVVAETLVRLAITLPDATLGTRPKPASEEQASEEPASEEPAQADRGDPVSVAAHVADLARTHANAYTAALWPRMLLTLANAEMFAGSPERARHSAMQAVHLAPWDADAWRTLRSA